MAPVVLLVPEGIACIAVLALADGSVHNPFRSDTRRIARSESKLGVVGLARKTPGHTIGFGFDRTASFGCTGLHMVAAADAVGAVDAEVDTVDSSDILDNFLHHNSLDWFLAAGRHNFVAGILGLGYCNLDYSRTGFGRHRSHSYSQFTEDVA